MRLPTVLRTHPAVPALPLVGLLFSYIFLTSTRHIEQLVAMPWATQAASYAVHAPAPMAAAAAAGLTAVEATRLKALGTWELGAAIPTWRIALQPVLITVACLSIPTAGIMAASLWLVGASPDLYTLQLLAIVVVLLTAHSVIGFVIGRRLHALYSAPLLAVAVFVGTSFPLGTDYYWAHHVTGSISWVGFGQAYSPAMTAAALLPTVCLSVACVALAGPRRLQVRSAALALVVTTGGLLGAYAITMDWRSMPPTSRGLAPVTCVGEEPEVCLPEAGAAHIDEVREGIKAMTGRLKAAGVLVREPERITDVTVAEKQRIDTTGDHWTLALAPDEADRALRENIAISVVGMPCENPDWNTLHYPTLWVAEIIGVRDNYLTWLSRETEGFSHGQSREQLLSETDRVNDLSSEERKAWYRQQIRSACQAGH
ncbi:DUF7224 domain-containing protein [Streptomyces fragilis]|uniref:Magnesium transporter n=1 Tax=Streptomyces fragilis TaxID=67301 RepID=A0ABV2YHC3_9ACTN|nr:hypothetical protein [Streptomyces fragilis]